MKSFLLRALAIVILTTAGATLNTSFAQFDEAATDQFIEDVRERFEVPGLSVAIVKDGQLVMAKGYGVRSLQSDATVDEHTLFGIASNTKAFTATALGMLVEEGKIGWNEPVIEYLPDFRMSDPYVTAEITVRDLLVHRSGLGLGSGDLMWWPPSTLDRKEIVRRIRYLPLVTSFRNAYAYDNVLYSVAGEVIEAVSGLTWEEFVQTRILDRIGMTASNVLHSAAGDGHNAAEPHAAIDGVVKNIAAFKSDNTNPAGGINASAADIAKWMIVQLDSGRVDTGERLFSEQTTRELWSIVTPIPSGNPPEYLSALKTNFNGYALGFGIRDYRGKKMVTHTGGLPGFVSRLTMLPELKLGVAVFTNQESGYAFNAVTQYVLDAYLGADDTDWLEALSRARDETKARIAQIEAAAVQNRNEDSTPSLDLETYAGTYRDVWYGEVYLTHEDGSLRMDFSNTPSLIGTLEHWQYDTFVVRWDDRELRADAYVTFVLSPEGSIDEIRMLPASPLVDFSYDFQDLKLERVR